MPRLISTEMRSHLDGSSIQLVTCWIITRRDGTVFRLTDNTIDLTFDGETYTSLDTYNRTAIANASDLSTDNLDVFAVLNSGEITDFDLKAGKFDHAAIEVFLVNHSAPDTYGKMKLKVGWFGEIKPLTNATGFTTTLVGLMDKLDSNIETYIKPECSLELGETKCGVELQADPVARGEAYAEGDLVRQPPSSTSGSRIVQVADNVAFEDFSVFYDTDGDGDYRFHNGTGEMIDEWGETASLEVTDETGDGIYTRHPTDGSEGLPSEATYYLQGNFGADFVICQYAAMDDDDEVALDLSDGNSELVASLYLRIRDSSETIRIRIRAFDATDTVIETLYDSGEQTAAEWGMAVDEFTAFSFGDMFLDPDTAYLEFYVRGGDTSGTNRCGYALPKLYVIESNGLTSTVDISGKAYRCTTAGTTALTAPVYSETVGDVVADGTAEFTVEQAYRVAATVTEIVDDATIKVQIFNETRGEADASWFRKGIITFIDGENQDQSLEVKSCVYDGLFFYEVETFLPRGGDVQIGDFLWITPGCDFSRETCRDKFDNVLNHRGYPDLPGTDAISQYNVGA